MNVSWVTFHLEEAKEQIEETLLRIHDASSDDASLNDEDFRIEVRHMLHHIHTAYNSRNVVDAKAITEAQFYINERPPEDMEWE